MTSSKPFALAGGVAGLCLLLLCLPARPSEFVRSGTTITMSGTIVDGDDLKFKALLQEGTRIEVVNLDSGGGKIEPAGQISRMIRAGGVATLVDGGRAKCASACTVIFGGGVRRYYVNADALSEGPMSKSNFTGLGFHEGNSPLALSKNRYSGQATASMIKFYYEMGISSAKDLVVKAPPEQYYRISGRTALSLGIATSISRP
ncbi:hypothetical protein SAMN05519104_5830 [Rhizobiales bacterium GAS188]|jgi:hypothetical protein|nr:hypothetical protein SAMN05519104_5830 [Rhizobiales bacterium GAS188]